MLGKKRICHSYSPVMSSLTYDSILVFAAHGSERPNLYRMSTSPLSFLVVGVGQDFTCKWIGFRCEIRLITTACEQLDSCFPGYSTDCAKDSSLLETGSFVWNCPFPFQSLIPRCFPLCPAPHSTFAVARRNDSFNLGTGNQDTLLCSVE